jgi:hypothetical protein
MATETVQLQKIIESAVIKSASLQMAKSFGRNCLIKDHLKGIRVGLKNWPALSVAVQSL